MDDKELEKAYYLTLENAEMLFKEATVLKNASLFPRAYSLFHFAIEECGKCAIIYNAIISFYHDEKIDWPFLKSKGFEEHPEKIEQSIRTEFAAVLLYQKSTARKTSLAKEVLSNFNRIGHFNELKNKSLYVGYNGNKFISPTQAITEKLVLEIEFDAKLRCVIARQSFLSLKKIQATAKILREIINDPKRQKELEDRLTKTINDSI